MERQFGGDVQGRRIVIAVTPRIPGPPGERGEPGELDLTSVSKLLLPEIDEDGRSGYWRDRVEALEAKPQAVIVTLTGVGTRVEWAWNQVVEAVSAP